MKKTVFSLSFLLLPVLAFSQGEFLQKGQNGFGITAGYVHLDETNGFTTGAGLSIGTIVDFGFSYSKVFIRGKEDYPISTWSPSLTILVLKQEESPTGIMITAGYIHESVEQSTSNGFAFGINLYTRSDEFGGIYAQPSFSLSYYIYSAGTEYESSMIINLGLPFVFRLKNSNLLLITPAFSTGVDKLSYSLNFSLIFPST